MPRVVDHIDSDIQLFPESNSTPEPFPGRSSIHQRSRDQRGMGTTTQYRLVKHLGDILLSLGGPSSEVSSQASDEGVQDVERPVVFLETGPLVRKLKGPANGRKPLQLLNRLSRLITVKIDLKCTMWPPGHVPAGFQAIAPTKTVETRR